MRDPVSKIKCILIKTLYIDFYAYPNICKHMHTPLYHPHIYNYIIQGYSLKKINKMIKMEDTVDYKGKEDV